MPNPLDRDGRFRYSEGKKKAKPHIWRWEGFAFKAKKVSNYNNSSQKSQLLLPKKPTFWLYFSLKGAGVEWIDEGLPIPNYLKHDRNGLYSIAWQIEGYFATAKSIKFLNDVIARMTIAMKECNPRRYPFKPDTRSADHYYPKIYKMREIIKELPSINKNRHYAPMRADSFGDYVFWAIKLWTEDEIRSSGEGIPINYSHLESWALSQFIDKERSTIRAKCRSVWGWYDKHNWELKKRSWKMTRRERAISNAKAMEEKKYKAVVNAVTGLYADEYKKKNGTWNISKIAKSIGIKRDTVSKHLKRFEEQQQKAS